MSERYIRENVNSFAIVKSSRNYGKFDRLDEALFLRDELIRNDWDLDSLDEVYMMDDDYLVVRVIDDKLHVLSRQRKKPSDEAVERLAKKHIRNPNNSRYGLNITKVFDIFVIKKQIAGEDHVFGYYDNLQDCEFARNYLLDHDWNVNGFSQIEYDDESDDYKVVEVIDDKAYVLATFKGKDEIDIAKCHEEFLNKITKHRMGLAMYPHLFELTDEIPRLEERFSTKARDEVWSFKNTENPLNDIIFNLTPFQKSVYDAIDNSTFEDIRKSLIRYKSGNFDGKIQKNLDELEKLDLIEKNQNNYIKKNK